MAGENSKPNRLLAGQQTRLSRTMHDVRYDAVHDEMYVTNPFSRAILVFRGGADGEEGVCCATDPLLLGLGGRRRWRPGGLGLVSGSGSGGRSTVATAELTLGLAVVAGPSPCCLGFWKKRDRDFSKILVPFRGPLRG